MLLVSPRGESLTGIPWTVYPRPQLRRESYISLNGDWDFGTDPHSFSRTIRLPFCPEASLSGIGEHFPEGKSLCYRRFVTLPDGFHGDRLLLHIGGADQRARVYVNGALAGEHSGGYEAFCMDVTDQWRDGENEVIIHCQDDLRDASYPYGKQVRKRGGMWYTPVSGIWQSVWMEDVPQRYIEKLNIENRGKSVTISVHPPMDGKITVAGLGEFLMERGSATITPEQPHLWSPEDPYLYDFTLEAGEDRVESYFALRTLEIRQVGDYPRLCLNGQPYFFHGLLDQGYWPEGLLTPPDPACYADDILAMKALGFNTLRKHIKVEPEEFYYQCDRLGMIVFQDMVNNGTYAYLRDTALPTVFLSYQKRSDRTIYRPEAHKVRFLECMEATVRQLKNHPCICYWTIFNEGWGQFDSDNVYEQFRKLDDTRFIDSTSGWFRQKKSDVDSRHVYFRKVNLKGNGIKPLVVSEFGGKALAVEDHLWCPDKSYGYGACRTKEELGRALRALYLEEVLPCVKNGLCAAIYTQVSDVEEEINGLLTYDRKVVKADAASLVSVAAALQEAIRGKTVVKSGQML